MDIVEVRGEAFDLWQNDAAVWLKLDAFTQKRIVTSNAKVPKLHIMNCPNTYEM